MDTETRELFADVIGAMQALNAQAAAQTHLAKAVSASIDRIDRRLDAHSTIIRALSGDERVLHEHDH